jgi:hypothetical protein
VTVPNPPVAFRSAVYTLTVVTALASYFLQMIAEQEIANWEELIAAFVAAMARANLSDR